MSKEIVLYDYDKNEIKESLDIEQVALYLDELGGDPEIENGAGKIVSKTICHCGDTHKLYYYNNTKLFKCFTDCGDSFDIFELTRKVQSVNNKKTRFTKEGRAYLDDWNLPEAIHHVAQFFGFAPVDKEMSALNEEMLVAWRKFNNYNRIKEVSSSKDSKTVTLKEYDANFLKNLPTPNILPWLREGITQEVMNNAGICYNPKSGGIVIPHYDAFGRVVGIRERTMVEEKINNGKYRPAYINKNLFNHPLSLNLYNLNNSKENIRKMGKAFVFESEKSSLLYASYFGLDNDISVACCGSSLIKYQVKLLIDAGAKEIVIGFDKQFKQKNDKEFKKLVKNLKNINTKYGSYVKISFLFDKEDLLGYKDSPIDCGKETFLQLFKERIIL